MRSKRNIVQHLRRSFPANSDYYVPKSLRTKASFAVREIILQISLEPF